MSEEICGIPVLVNPALPPGRVYLMGDPARLGVLGFTGPALLVSPGAARPPQSAVRALAAEMGITTKEPVP